MRAIAGKLLAEIVRRSYNKLPIVGRDGFDISEVIKLRASMDTAEYCMNHLARVRTFPSALDLLTCALQHVTLTGCFLEFGVASGRTINHIAASVPGTVHGFDSFAGLPEDWRPGVFEKGSFAQKIPAVHKNVELHVGLFHDTLPRFVAMNHETVAFLHVDCDLYSSTKEIFGYLGNRIVPGTVIVFDEYFNHPTWRLDEWRAFQEFVTAMQMTYDYIGYVAKRQQAAVVIRSKAVQGGDTLN